MSRLEPASFEVERFEFGPGACLEVHGRWSGVRGRRFVRPTLKAVTEGREHRVLAVLDHKPWIAEEGESWLAAFPWSTDPAALLEAELTVAPDVTVPLPALSARGGSRRVRSRRASARQAVPASKAGKSSGRPGEHGGTQDARLPSGREAAPRSRDEARIELGAMKRERDRLRLELEGSLAAHEAAIAERRDVIEAELERRNADIRAEAEREGALAVREAQFERERETARAACAEAIRERDAAHAERDAARRERDRMLANRDTARARARDAMRQWEVTAALGARRTQERDAALNERDRVARERDAALRGRECVTRERDAAAQERDVLIERHDRLQRERDAGLHERDRARRQIPAPDERSTTQLALAYPQAITPPTTAVDATRVPRRPPAPAEVRPRDTVVRGEESSPCPKTLAPQDAAQLWRARLLAFATLLVAVVVFVVILTAR